jgi:hypothetical protein
MLRAVQDGVLTHQSNSGRAADDPSLGTIRPDAFRRHDGLALAVSLGGDLFSFKFTVHCQS